MNLILDMPLSNCELQLLEQAVTVFQRVSDLPLYFHYMQAEADLEIRSDEGSTPLYVASSNGNFPAVTVLLKAGADVEAVFHKSGTTPLMAAALSGSTTVVAALLAHGPDLDARSPFGYSSLHFGAISGSVDVVKVGSVSHVSGYAHSTGSILLIFQIHYAV